MQKITLHLFQTIISLNVRLEPLELQSVLGGLLSRKVSPRLLIKASLESLCSLPRQTVSTRGVRRRSAGGHHFTTDGLAGGVWTAKTGVKRVWKASSGAQLASHFLCWTFDLFTSLTIKKKRYFYEKSKMKFMSTTKNNTSQSHLSVKIIYNKNYLCIIGLKDGFCKVKFKYLGYEWSFCCVTNAKEWTTTLSS